MICDLQPPLTGCAATLERRLEITWVATQSSPLSLARFSLIVGFSLWPVLNGATNSLYSYFRNSCDDGNGNRFLSVYFGDDTESLPSTLDPGTYYTKGFGE